MTANTKMMTVKEQNKALSQTSVMCRATTRLLRKNTKPSFSLTRN